MIHFSSRALVVFWLICALVLAGASVICVIRRRLRPGTHWDRSGSAAGAHRRKRQARPGYSGLASRANPIPLNITLLPPTGLRRV